MSTQVQDNLLQEQLKELIKVGVGGKFKDTNDYTAKIQEELEFEEAMLRGGIDRYNHLINEAKAKRQESTTMYGLFQQQKYIVDLSALIYAKVLKIELGQVGRNHIAIEKIVQCLPQTAFEDKKLKPKPSIFDTCSLIILKNIIDGISNENTLNSVAIQIGNALMMEARILMFKEQKRDQYNQVFKRLEGKNIPQKANRWQYKKNVWVYCMNKHDLKFENWRKEDMLHLGAEMVHLVARLNLVETPYRNRYKHKTVKLIVPSKKMIAEIKKFNIKNEALYPRYLPMLMPPRNWENPFVGGYYGRKHNFENKAEEIANALQPSKSN